MMISKGQFDRWFSDIVEGSKFSLVDIPLTSSNDWSYKDGAIRHRSGSFFSVIGVSWESTGKKRIQQPMIDQREVGTLGFAVRTRNGSKELLAQAKLEPGNIGPVQIAPTCQATASNIAIAHGGKRPPFSELFAQNGRHVLSDSLQSEQGSRFFGKRNRNMLIDVNEDISEGLLHKWVKTEELLSLIDADFFINTDARSVLVTSPWKKLCQGEPFAKNDRGFGAELRISMSSGGFNDPAQVIKKIVDMRATVGNTEIIDINDIAGWHFDLSDPETLKGREYSVKHIKVGARLREVEEWDQPIIDSHREGLIELVCGRINGVINFAFNPQIEPGLVNSAELGPTFIREPGRHGPTEAPSFRGKPVIETRQSEEGGRFFRDINLYRIIDIGEVPPGADGCSWLSLRDIQELLLQGNWFTNEARSILSLLLKWV